MKFFAVWIRICILFIMLPKVDYVLITSLFVYIKFIVKGKTTFLNLLLGKFAYKGSIDTTTTFDYFLYQITEHQMQLPTSAFMEELKASCEPWRVIYELDGLGENAEILYRPYQTLSPGERTKIGFDPIKEHDRFWDTRAYIGAKTKKMQSRVKQMENRINWFRFPITRTQLSI